MTLVADVTKEWLVLRNHVTNRRSRINIPCEVTNIVFSFLPLEAIVGKSASRRICSGRTTQYIGRKHM